MSFEFLLCASNITNRWNQLKSYSCGKHVFTHSSRYDIEPKQLRLPLESEILVNQSHKPIKVNISVYQWKAEWFYASETRFLLSKSPTYIAFRGILTRGRRIGSRLRQLQICNYRELTCSRAALHHKQNCTQTLAIVLDWHTLSPSTLCENTLKPYKKVIIIIKYSINGIKLNCVVSL